MEPLTSARPLDRWRPGDRIRCLACCALAAAVVIGVMPTNAHGETPITAQAIADDGAFLPYAPPPAQPAGLCQVDTGVDANPDTEGVVVERAAIEGGSGEDVSPELHGTELAMMAAAPLNGWGMVGTAPGAIRIVSVRILQPGMTTFPLSSYAAGITVCLQLRQRFDIQVINLSLGNAETPSAQDYDAVANAIERAVNYNVAVVAAAGNDNGGPLDFPAAYPSVLSVAASDTADGAFCAFSNRGTGLRLLAPGCDLTGADPLSSIEDSNYWQGSSEASEIASAALAALRAYQPELSESAAEQTITSANSGVLDIAQAFRDAGLGAIVVAGEAAEPRAPSPSSVTFQTTATLQAMPTPSTATPSTALLNKLATPRAQLKRRAGRLLLVLDGRPSGVLAQVRLLGHHGRSRRLAVLRTLTGPFTTLTIPTAGTLEVAARYTDPYDITRASPWTTLQIPRTTTQRPNHRPPR
jgi:hypothetical protein